MLKLGHSVQLDATDLVGHLSCGHLTQLDHAVALGSLERPRSWDPMLEVMRERGARHERAYVDHLAASGLQVTMIGGIGVDDAAVAETLQAMRAGAAVIVQAALRSGRWVGRADVLRRVETPSDLGEWSYEPLDTKLARETKASAVMQLCLYSELLKDTQGVSPEHAYVVPPWTAYEAEPYRVSDFAAYFRRIRQSLERTLDETSRENSYPDPNDYCDICRWRARCEERRTGDDHLCLVAGISKVQINELGRHGVVTATELASLPLPIPWRPERGAPHSYGRIREQARIQVEGRRAGAVLHELLLPLSPDCGLPRLPEPTGGDIFLDLEGDPFVGESGLEYLFGYAWRDADGQERHTASWALSRAAERHAFEEFIDFVLSRLERWPGLHVYHFAPYEPAALKRLMGRYATRQEEMDRLLRSKVFVDLYAVVRHGIRASVESYSIKQLEPLYGFVRETELATANQALARLQGFLELGDHKTILDEDRLTVEGYNRDDCVSTWRLRNWLEELRDGLLRQGMSIDRPVATSGEAGETVSEWLARIGPVVAKLTDGVPDDVTDRTLEQHARWILAQMLDWHRREEKATWWEYFRLADLTVEDLLEERGALSGLEFLGTFGGTTRAPVHRYRFPPQETQLRGDEDLRARGGAKLGTLAGISIEERWADIKKRQDSVSVHPEAVFAHSLVRTDVLKEALLRLGEHVAGHGMEGPGPFRAARGLLMREPPRVGGQGLQAVGEQPLDTAVRLAPFLDGGVLPIQGPPGAGKTHTGARMICKLAESGRTVGVTANSHKVIRNLLDAVMKAAEESGVGLTCIQKASEREADLPRLIFAKDNAAVLAAVGRTCQVAGGTAWLWASPDAFEAVDVLVVDEAAQMSLANVLAVAQAANSIVLLGDPQQLEQPIQGSHPEGTDVSALHHLLGGMQTIPPDRGLFLEETWRLQPEICAFTSELFYEGRLKSRAGSERQRIVAVGLLSGSGLRLVPILHEGNQSSSPEEADRVCTLVLEVLASDSSWVDADGTQRPLTLADILVIAPYNAQVFELQERLPGARVGTVDKFQGQEAPLVIYSMTTSSHADAPRGMEFLYSLNRLNVATSRAKCVCVLVASPALLAADCRTPRQMQLVNAYCRYLELSQAISPSDEMVIALPSSS